MPVDLDQALHVAFWMDAPMLPVFGRLVPRLCTPVAESVVGRSS
jgi:hypothetical protein